MSTTRPEGQRNDADRRVNLLVVVVAILGAIIAGLVVVVFILLKSRAPIAGLEERLPGMDRSGAAGATTADLAFKSGKLTAGPGTPANLQGLWPQFRGPKGDNIAAGDAGISKSCGKGGPAVCWSVDLGEGYAGASVRNGRVYVLDYDQTQKADAVRCLSLADGKEIWNYSYPVKTKRNHGMSRTVPTVTDKFVISLGPKCHVTCLDAEKGEFKWGIDLVQEYNSAVPEWYAGQCPLVDGDRVILAPCGDALMIAVDIESGKVLWKTPNPRDWKMTHVSILPMEIAGKKMFVYCGSGGVAGISAADGQILWETDAWAISIATVPSPVAIGDGRIFLSGGYNSGAMMLQLKEAGGKISAEPLYRLKPAEFGATQQTPVLYEGHIYGIRPDGQLTCLGLDGKIRWASGGAAKFGLGPFLIAGGMILAMNDEGLLTMAEAVPEKYKPVAQAKVLSGHDSWAPMALAGSRLIARDLTKMVCLDLSGAKP